jgi:uncharacterized protein YjgD (DUF1641 family)
MMPIFLDEEGNVIKPSVGNATAPRKYVDQKPIDKAIAEANKPIVKRKRRKRLKLAKLADERNIKFIENIAKGMPKGEAAMDAFKPSNMDVAKTMATRKLKDKDIQSMVMQVFKKNEVRLEDAMKPIIKGLKAKKVVQYKEDVFVSDIDDLSLQIQASDRALKLMGATGKKNEEPTSANYIQVNNYHKDKYND